MLQISTSLPSFDQFSQNLFDVALMLSGENSHPEKHTYFFRVQGTKTTKNYVVFGDNVSQEDKSRVLQEYPNAVFLYGYEKSLKILYGLAKTHSIYLRFNGIDRGTKKTSGITTARAFVIEWDYLDNLDVQFAAMTKLCKLHSIPTPSYFYQTGGKSLHGVWIFREAIPAVTAWAIYTQVRRLAGSDGCHFGIESLASYLTFNFRLGGQKIQKSKNNWVLGGTYGSFKCLNTGNVSSPSDFDSLFVSPLGLWNSEHTKPGCTAENSYPIEDRFLPSWRDKFLPYDSNEVVEAQALLDNFTTTPKQAAPVSRKTVSTTAPTTKKIDLDLSAIATDKTSIFSFLLPSSREKLQGISQEGRYLKLYGLAVDLRVTETALERLNLPTNPTAYELFLSCLDTTYGNNEHKKQEAIKLRWQSSAKAVTSVAVQQKIEYILQVTGNTKQDDKPTGFSSVANADISSDVLHLVFDSDLLENSTLPTILLSGIKQKSVWLSQETKELLKPQVSKAKQVFVNTANCNWSKEQLINLGSFCLINGAVEVFVNGVHFDYFSLEDKLTLSGKDVIPVNQQYLEPQPLLDLVIKKNAKCLLLESPPGSNKTGAGLAIAAHFGIKHNIPILLSAATRSLCRGLAARFKELTGFSLPIVDDNWFKNKPKSKESFTGAIFCPDSENNIISLIDDFEVSDWVYVIDECSATLHHSHFSSTAIANNRAKHLHGLSRLASGAIFNLYMEANITSPAQSWVESKVKGNILKIKNDYKTKRDFILWQGKPHTMLSAMIAVRNKLPESTILLNTQAREIDSSLSPTNLKKFLVEVHGFSPDDIILMDAESRSNSSHPAYDVLESVDKKDYFFSETVKGKIVIGNPSLFSTGTNINKHCFDYTFDILQGKGTPMSALQQPLRVRDRVGLERHIYINNCGLDHPRYKGYSPEKIAKSIQEKLTLTNNEYERLGGAVDFSRLTSDFDSAKYVCESQYLQTQFVKSYFHIATGLMKHHQGWNLISSDDWTDKHTLSYKKDIDDNQQLHLLNEDFPDVKQIKSHLREIKEDGHTLKIETIANSELIDDNSAKNLRNSRTELSLEEQSKLDRYDFHKASLGTVQPTVDNVSRWQDGYYSKLRFMFYFLGQTKDYLRIRESKNLEINSKDGHTFDFDRLSRSSLAAYSFLRELKVNILITELIRISQGLSLDNHIFFKDAPVELKECKGLPLDFDDKSALVELSNKLLSDPIKCYNLLGFTPGKSHSSNIEKLLNKFGYERQSNGKKGKSCKHYLIGFDDNRLEFFSDLLRQHQLSVHDKDSPDYDFLLTLTTNENTKPITQDYQRAVVGMLNTKNGQANILDLIDIGGATPLETILISGAAPISYLANTISHTENESSRDRLLQLVKKALPETYSKLVKLI